MKHLNVKTILYLRLIIFVQISVCGLETKCTSQVAVVKEIIIEALSAW